MDKIVVQPTATAEWHALVNQAERQCGRRLAEELESYLVFLLQRFTRKPEVATMVFAVPYLHAHLSAGAERREILRDVGDGCLLIAGFFPKVAMRRHVPIAYFVDLGQGAYSTLSTSIPRAQIASAELFNTLSLQFVGMMDLLQSIRELGGKEYRLTPLEAEELWRKTGSTHAFERLRHYTEGGGPLFSEA